MAKILYGQKLLKSQGIGRLTSRVKTEPDSKRVKIKKFNRYFFQFYYHKIVTYHIFRIEPRYPLIEQLNFCFPSRAHYG